MRSLWSKVVVSLTASGSLLGCHPGIAELVLNETAEVAAHVLVDAAVASLVTASVRAAYSEEHPRIGHHPECGHDYIVYDGRDVYFAEDRWEFFDEEEGRWFYFVDQVPWE